MECHYTWHSTPSHPLTPHPTPYPTLSPTNHVTIPHVYKSSAIIIIALTAAHVLMVFVIPHD